MVAARLFRLHFGHKYFISCTLVTTLFFILRFRIFYQLHTELLYFKLPFLKWHHVLIQVFVQLHYVAHSISYLLH